MDRRARSVCAGVHPQTQIAWARHDDLVHRAERPVPGCAVWGREVLLLLSLPSSDSLEGCPISRSDTVTAPFSTRCPLAPSVRRSGRWLASRRRGEEVRRRRMNAAAAHERMMPRRIASSNDHRAFSKWNKQAPPSPLRLAAASSNREQLCSLIVPAAGLELRPLVQSTALLRDGLIAQLASSLFRTHWRLALGHG